MFRLIFIIIFIFMGNYIIYLSHRNIQPSHRNIYLFRCNIYLSCHNIYPSDCNIHIHIYGQLNHIYLSHHNIYLSRHNIYLSRRNIYLSQCQSSIHTNSHAPELAFLPYFSVITVSVVVDSLTCKFMACTSRDQTRVTSEVRFTNNLRKTKITDIKIHKNGTFSGLVN